MQDFKNYFFCQNCNKKVYIEAPGTKNRNHCPYCLYSVHVDNIPGDRKSFCGGLMEPVGKFYKDDGEEILVHKCLSCGFIRKNRVAGDDSYSKMDKLVIVEKF